MGPRSKIHSHGAWLILFMVMLSVTSRGISEEIVVEAVQLDGTFLNHNGADQIPIGMFGVHATKLSPERIADWGIESVREMVWVPNGVPRTPGNGFPAEIAHYVECFFDRYRPALQLTDPTGWRSYLEGVGRKYGEAAKKTGFQHHIEFWNEPYLNWASRPGVNYDPVFYERDGIQAGDPVHIKGQPQPTEYLIWKQGHFLADAESGQPTDIMGYVRGGNFMRDPFSDSLMRGKKFNEAFTFQGKHLIAKPMLVPFDPTQFERQSAGNRWWSGQQNRVWYQEMLVTFGKALKAVNQDVKLAAGWGFHFNQGGWLAWNELYKPVLEAGIEYVDAVHEHHYGGDTRMVASNYEVVWNWAKAHHGKSLEFWNTEAGGQLDPQRPDVVKARPEGGPLERAMGAATYTLRDIIFLLSRSPEKATARAAHEAHHNGGDAFAFRLLKTLRGDLLSIHSPRQDLWSVAALNRELNTVVMTFFNDRRDAQTIPLLLVAPAGYKFVQGGVVHSIGRSEGGKSLQMIERPLSTLGKNLRGPLRLTIPSKTALVVSIPVTAIKDFQGQQPVRTIQQIPAKEMFQNVSPTQAAETTIAIDPDLIKRADRASIRLGIVNYQGGETLSINGHKVTLQGGNWLHQQWFDPAWLQPINRIRIESEEQSFHIMTTALTVEYLSTEE